MADPQIKSPMDNWDYATVSIYRSGFVIATFMLFLLPYQTQLAQQGLLIAGTMLASSLHLYLKHFRLIFQFSVWLGLLSHILGFPLLSLGAMLLVIGGLSYKEYFCFKILGLNCQPILVALLWIAVATEQIIAVRVLSAMCAILLLILSIKKWQMPLYFDIGDKSKYQV